MDDKPQDIGPGDFLPEVEPATPYSRGFAVLVPIDKLARALVAAQKELKNPPKTRTAKIVSARTGGKFSYSYADLADVTDAVRPALSKNGLAMLHLMQPNGQGGYILVARMLHESGQYLDSIYPVPKDLMAQDLGSWLTYMRRYSTCNMAFVAGETDEDGEAATAEQIAKEEAETAAKRAEAEKKLDELKAKGRITSAYTGKTVAPGESVLPAKEEPKKEEPKKEEAKEEPKEKKKEPKPDPLEGIPPKLADVMRRDGVTVEQITVTLGPKPKGYGYQPAGVGPAKWPADFIDGITKEQNWTRIVAKIRSA
jgi:hypothetical protein